MGILTDRQIRAENIVSPLAECETRPGKVSYGLTSYGYDARIGYAFRVFKPYPCTVIDPKAFDDRMLEAVDLTPRPHSCCTGDGMRECEGCTLQPDHILIPPHSFVLGETVETFTIPRDVLAVVVGKSTYARCGLIVNVTPLEPEWSGVVTVELTNPTPLPIKVYTGEGIMQVLFLRSDASAECDRHTMHATHEYLYEKVYGKSDVSLLVPKPAGAKHPMRSCAVSYADKKGRYQGQTGVTTPTVDACPLCAGTGKNRAGQACVQCDARGTV